MKLIWDEEAWDDYNRLVYKVEDNELRIAQCKTHYEK